MNQFNLIMVFLYVHVTFVCYSIYIHRALAHRSVTYHSIIEKAFRFWIWLTIGMPSKYKTASHILHHKLADRQGDPHSPLIDGRIRMLIWKPIYKMFEFFVPPNRQYDNSQVEKYVRPTSDQGYEFRYSRLGPTTFLIVNTVFFGYNGIVIVLCYVMLISVLAYTVADGFGHLIGYRNHKLQDNSHNIIPWGLFLAGEELHNNHHAHAGRAKLSEKWYEFDIGYLYIRLLEIMNLARIR